MNKEEYEKHKPFAGEKKPSMLRRRVGHDYESRRIYLITMTVEGRRPLLGKLAGRSDAEKGTAEYPRVELSELGKRVRGCWMEIETLHPEIKVVALQMMPDHLHGILFVRERMGQHLGKVIKGFKTGCNKAYRELLLGQPVNYAATLLQQSGQKKPKDDRTHGYLWSRGYNDHILSGKGELQRWIDYLHTNPLRLLIKREHPDLFRVRFGINIAGQTYAAIGNQFLLNYPRKLQVQCSRSLTDEQIQEKVAFFLKEAKQGAILVSPAISKGEQAIMRAALDARLPLIFLTPWGFNTFSKPGHQYFQACSEGRFLILAPWEHQNQRIPLTREMCLTLNGMTQTICKV
ncbi:MAG: hypothetical protein IJP82_03690 [Bacteroidaceae bacterium]|nr:hypothetical protein [Bacteroidaceae bacterium]